MLCSEPEISNATIFGLNRPSNRGLIVVYMALKMLFFGMGWVYILQWQWLGKLEPHYSPY